MPEYIAISYTWDDTMEKEFLALEEASMPLSISIYGALIYDTRRYSRRARWMLDAHLVAP